nr:unnamed protein product [Callosobruchus analis]
MVRNCKRKTERGNWSEESMKNAVNAVVKREMGYKLAAKTYSVPQTTLQRKVKVARVALEDPAASATSVKVPLGPKRRTFSYDEEKELCNYILDMESRLYGLTPKDLRALLLHVPLDLINKLWYHFFNFLGKVYDKHKLSPDRIYNCDETGVSVVPKTKSKIIARKGRKQVGSITSAERGTTITIEIWFSASGQYMPPVMVFPR